MKSRRFPVLLVFLHSEELVLCVGSGEMGPELGNLERMKEEKGGNQEGKVEGRRKAKRKGRMEGRRGGQ